ncbi:hypothetical protein CHUAL_000832 [Chamberlinius hualienensis]
MFSRSTPYQPMEEDIYESINSFSRGSENQVATINDLSNYHELSTVDRPPPPEYSTVVFNQPSTSLIQMQSAVSPGEPYLGLPHDVDYAGTMTQTGTLNLLAMSEIRLKTRTPMEITCPHCYMQVVTMLKPKRGIAAYLLFVLLILCGCILGCCLIPLYWTPCLDIKHYCPHCHKLIGVSHVL